MATLSPDSDEAKRIDAALQDWRQGDLALEESWFVHVGDPGAPLTDAAAEAADGDLQALTSEVRGLIVVSQTCDIVRACVHRPYVEIAPLVQVSEDDLQMVKRGRRPAYATLPSLEPDCLVADLDRVMTVEKSIVASWKRTPGYLDDAAGRGFAQALARKRVRFAFPDDFTSLVDKLQRRLVDKHDKDSVEGRGLRALRDIRVRAAPSWDAAEVEILFWFVREGEGVIFEGKSWPDLLNSWLKLVPASGRFKAVEGQVVVLEDMTQETTSRAIRSISTTFRRARRRDQLLSEICIQISDSVLVIARAEISIRIDLRRYQRHAAVRSQLRNPSLTPSQALT